MFVWIYLLYCLIAITFLGIFLPEGVGGGIHNVPLFITFVLILTVIFSVRLIKYLKVFSLAKKHLRAKGYTVLECSVLPTSWQRKKHCHIVAEKDGKTVRIYVEKPKKSYYTYHFSSEAMAEIYKSTRLAIKPSMWQANIISKKLDRKRVGTRKFNWSEEELANDTCVVLFSQLPDFITDSESKEALYNGSKICDKVYLYDLNGFDRSFK